MTLAMISGSSRIRRSVAGHRDEPARRQLGADGVAHDVLEHVGLVEHHDVVLGQDHAAAADVQPVEVGVDDDDVGRRGPPAGLLGEARLAERAAVGARALVAADADRPPRRVRRRPVELGGVAAVAGAGPLGDAADLRSRAGGHPVQLELGVGAAALDLAQPLQADVVAAALEDGPVERRRQHRRPGTAGPCRPAGPAAPWSPWPRRPGRRTARPARGRRASCRCRCRPARRGGGRCRWRRRRAGPSRPGPAAARRRAARR